MGFQYLSQEFCPANKSMFAKVVEASRSLENGSTLYTVHVRAPRIIWAEIMTHRVFSRNARSSRAVPVKTMLNEVRNDPFVPWHWTGAKPGMQGIPNWSEKILLKGSAGNFVDSDRPVDPALAWLHGRDMAADLAESYLDAHYHKQIANRLLEPFSWIDGLITSVQWNNFFHLRDHSDAEPHLQDLAVTIERAIARAVLMDLEPGDWHLPYVTQEDRDYANTTFQAWDLRLDFLRKISAARCARISYAPFDNNPGYDRELERYDLLVKSSRVHASPLEHQATPDTRSMTETRTFFEGGMVETIEGYAFDNGEFHGNLPGWIQNRHLVNEHFVHG